MTKILFLLTTLFWMQVALASQFGFGYLGAKRCRHVLSGYLGRLYAQHKTHPPEAEVEAWVLEWQKLPPGQKKQDLRDRVFKAKVAIHIFAAVEWSGMGARLDASELFHESIVALDRAMVGYDPAKGKFSTHLRQQIRGVLNHVVIEHYQKFGMANHSTGNSYLFARTRVFRYLQRKGLDPTPENLSQGLLEVTLEKQMRKYGLSRDAALMRLKEKKTRLPSPSVLEQTEAAIRFERSIERPLVLVEEESELMGMSPPALPDQRLGQERAQSQIQAAFSVLKEKLTSDEKLILDHFMNKLDDSGASDTELAQKLGVTRQAVQQRRTTLLAKLRKQMEATVGPDIFEEYFEE